MSANVAYQGGVGGLIGQPVSAKPRASHRRSIGLCTALPPRMEGPVNVRPACPFSCSGSLLTLPGPAPQGDGGPYYREGYSTETPAPGTAR